MHAAHSLLHVFCVQGGDAGERGGAAQPPQARGQLPSEPQNSPAMKDCSGQSHVKTNALRELMIIIPSLLIMEVRDKPSTGAPALTLPPWEKSLVAPEWPSVCGGSEGQGIVCRG